MCVSKHILIYNFTCCECNLVKEKEITPPKKEENCVKSSLQYTYDASVGALFGFDGGLQSEYEQKTEHRIIILYEEKIQLVSFEFHGKHCTIIEVPLEKMRVPKSKHSRKEPQYTRVSFSVDAESIAFGGSEDGEKGRLEIFRVETLVEMAMEVEEFLKPQGFKGETRTNHEMKENFRDLPLRSHSLRGGIEFWRSTKELEALKRDLELGRDDLPGGTKKRSSQYWCSYATSKNETKEKEETLADKRMAVWKSEEGYRGQFYIRRDSEVTCFEMSPTSNRIVVGEKKKGKAAIYVLPHSKSEETWKRKWSSKIGGHPYQELRTTAEESVKDVSFSGDGCRLCIALDSVVQVHDGASGSFIYLLSTLRGIKDVAFTRDGTRLAVASRDEDKAVTVWATATGTQLFKTQIKDGAVKLAFSPCDTFMVVGSKSKAQIVKPSTGKVLFMKHRKDKIGAVACSPDGTFFAFGHKNEIEVVDMASGSVVGQTIRVDGSAKSLTVVDYYDDGGGGGGDGEILVATYLVVVSSTSKASYIYIYKILDFDSEFPLIKTIKFDSEVNCVASSKTKLTVAHSFDMDGSKKGVCWLIAWRELIGMSEKVLIGFDSKGLMNSDEASKKADRKAGTITYSKSDLVGQKKAIAFPPLSNVIMTCDVVDEVPKVEHDGFEDVTGQEDEIIPMVAYGGLDGYVNVFDLCNLLDKESKLKRLARKKHQMEGAKAAVRTCKFIPGSGYLAVAGDFLNVMVYDPQHNCLPITSIATDKNGVVNPGYSLSFSFDGAYGAVGDSTGVYVFEIRKEDESAQVLFKIQTESRSFPCFCKNSSNDNQSEEDSKLVVGSFAKTVCVLEDVLKHGPPVSMLNEEVDNINHCMEHNPLLPIFTQIHCTLLDRTLNETLRCNGSLKLVMYNTIEAILSTKMGPMAIQPRHFLLAIVERDEHMLWLLLKGSCSERAPQRLRFDTTKMIPYMIEAKLTAALARLFEQNLALQDTGCEMHAVRRTVDWRAKLFEKFGHWLCDVLHWCTLESDQLFPAIRAFRNTFLVKDKEKIGWFWYYLIGGSASEPLHEDETVTHSEFDHFEPWGEYMDVEKGVMAKAVRVPLPALGTRNVLSQLVEIDSASLSNRIFGSEVMSAVIQCIYFTHFHVRHKIFTTLFLVEIGLWLRFCLNFKYYELESSAYDKPLAHEDDILQFFLVLVVIMLLWHEMLQQIGLAERQGGWAAPFFGYFPKGCLYDIDYWNVFDNTSQVMVLVSVGLSYVYTSEHIYHSEDLPWYLNRNSFLVLLALTSIVLLGKTVSYLRGFQQTAWLVVVLSQNLWDMRYFLILMFFCLIFFTGCFVMLFASAYMDKDELFDDEQMIDDTVEGLSGDTFWALMKVFEMGMLGGFSTTGFDNSADKELTSVVFIGFMLILQIVALNGLIALLGDSFARVLSTKDAKINLQLAKLMVEYMDCWEGPLFGWKELSRQRVKERENDEEKPRCDIMKGPSALYEWVKNWWVYANGGALEELESASLWTHRLKVSNSHEEKEAVLQQLFKLMECQRTEIDALKDLLTKDADFLKNEVIEVRKHVEKNVLMQYKALG